MAIDLTTPFVWGQGGARMTPEEIAQQRKVAESLLAGGMDYSPVKSPWQGAARVAQAVLGGLESREAGAASKRNASESGDYIAKMLAAAQGGATPAAATPVAPDPTATPIATGAAVPAGQTTIPSGSIDPRLSAAISSAAGTSGVDPAYMTRLALVENGGKVEGGSPLSSATGPFQFINSTAKQYGLTNPNDPAAAADAAARLTLDNKATLTQALGREPTLGELYLAHQQGAGGAAKLLANPNAPVEQVIGHTAAANNGATPGMTAGQFASKWTNKFADLGQPQVVDANAASPLDTAQYPAGPVGAPAAIAGNAGGTSPVLAGGQSSPLDTAMYPAGPVGAPMMAASGAAPADDPAALPSNAQPTQGTLPNAQAAQAAPAAAPSARPAINPVVLQALTSPYVDQQTKAIAGMLFKSQMDAQTKAADPLRNLQIQEAQTKLAPVGAPYKDADGNLVQKDALGKVTLLNPGDKTPTSVSEYKYYRDQVAEAGEKPLPYNQWDIARKHAGAISVNTGTIPPGYEQYSDPATGALRMRAIPGGPKDISEKDKAKADARATSTDVVTNAANLARKAIAGSTLPATGTAGSLLSGIGETGAAEVNRQIAVLKSNATIENLNAMRAQSPTGGALGNVTEGEGAMLAAKAGALDPRATKAQVERSLDDYEKTLLRIVHGKEAGDKIYEQTRVGKAQPGATAPVNGAVAVNPKTGERRVLQNGKWVPFS